MLCRKMQPIYLRLFTHLNIQTEGRKVGLNICRCVSRCECRRKHFQALSSVHTKASASQFSWLPLHSLSVSVYLWIISAVYCTHCQEQQSLEASLLICLFTKHVPERIRGKQRKHQPPRGIQGCYCRRQGLWENLTTQGLHYRRISRGKYTLAHLFFCKFI